MSAEMLSSLQGDPASRAKAIGCPDHVTAPDADDSAVVVGLALAYARTRPAGARTLPAAVLRRLDALADLGDPTCRLVRDWVAASLGANRSALSSGAAEMISLSETGEVR
jgi:hypothetical protein